MSNVNDEYLNDAIRALKKANLKENSGMDAGEECIRALVDLVKMAPAKEKADPKDVFYSRYGICPDFLLIRIN